MKTANLPKPASPALRFMSGLMGRLDQALNKLRLKQYIDELKGFKATKPFHKLAGYKGPKKLSRRDLHREMARGKNTKAYSRSIA